MATKQRFKLIPAVYLILRRDNEVLLLRRANTGYQDGKYGTIAGHLEGDELATVAVAREAKEEAGITIDPTKLTFVHLLHGLSRNDPGQERMSLFFETREWQGQIKIMEPEKCDDLSWYSIDNLPKNMLPLVRNTLRDVSNNIYYSEYTQEPT
jgi:8-oxo-dGTP pyrophosphatase MutT (NUDIX family)